MAGNLVTKLGTAVSEFWVTIGLMPSPTKIHNKSDKPIFLIPISCGQGADPLKSGKIEEKLAKKIKGKEIRSVDWSRYDRIRKGYSSETHIFFHTPSKTDDLKIYLESLKATSRKGIVLPTGEKLHGPNLLSSQSDLYLKHEGGKVKVYSKDGEEKQGEQAEQAPEPPVIETQQDLIVQVEELRIAVDVLKDQMAAVINFFNKLKQG